MTHYTEQASGQSLNCRKDFVKESEFPFHLSAGDAVSREGADHSMDGVGGVWRPPRYPEIAVRLPAIRRASTLAAALVVSAVTAQGQIRVRGKVQSESLSPLAGARVLARAGGEVAGQAFADLRGEFTVEVPAAGDYRFTVERHGYFSVRSQLVRVEESSPDLLFTLAPVREIVESLEVAAAAPGIDMETASSAQGVTNQEIVNVPYPNTNDFRSALRIVPGVVRDSRGTLHINGAAEEQSMFTLNGFNISDPLTGRFDSRFSVESVQSVDIASGNLPAEFGKGSAGTVAIRTLSGGDRFRANATNFLPGIENRKGLIIGDWTPRVSVTGPVRRGRAWFANSTDAIYTNTVIRELPKGQDRIASWRFSNLLSTQVNVTSSNILHAGFLVNGWVAPRTGLSALTPREATIDRCSRQWFFHLKDQLYLPNRALVEFGYAANRTYGREIPQGTGMLVFTPSGRYGNHYVDGVRNAGRDQILVSLFAPSFQMGGGHQVKGGIDLNRVTYAQQVRRTGFLNVAEDGSVVKRTVYGGSGTLSRNNFEAAIFVQDSWRVRPGLLLELGARGDWDSILHRWDGSPRVGFAWSPPRWENSKIYGGYARIFDATNLRLFTRPLDQYAISTYFGPGGEPARGPVASLFTILDSPLLRPRYQNWTLGAEHYWDAGISARVELLRRRGVYGFSFLPDDRSPATAPPLPIDFVFNLVNHRTESYDSVSFTVRQTIRRQYEWMASYTLSRALSSNVIDVTVEDPVSIENNAGRVPWDAPHRLLAWGYLPLPRKNWAVAFLVDTRSGFPFSTRAAGGAVVGPVSAARFPTYFEMNLHVERKLVFRSHRWALRVGANNLTNRFNPDSVNNVVGSPQYLGFFGGTGRSFNFRMRWLGKQ